MIDLLRASPRDSLPTSMSHPHDCISALRAKLATEPAPRPAMHANDILTPSSALSRGVANRDGPYIMHTDARCPLVNASAATSSAGATSVPARTRGKRHRPGTTTLHAHSGGTSANLASAHANTERPRGAGPVASCVIASCVVVVASCVVVVVVRKNQTLRHRPGLERAHVRQPHPALTELRGDDVERVATDRHLLDARRVQLQRRQSRVPRSAHHPHPHVLSRSHVERGANRRLRRLHRLQLRRRRVDPGGEPGAEARRGGEVPVG
mmetsp:Transcript_14803/g.60500  ORF Transcript_14803/g.60500 Transcript_14803/m.60500 type:complete len:267 (+) Transcript_14803:747-1547(+)